MSQTITAPEIDYRKCEVQKPTYRYSRLVQQTGGTNVTLSASSTAESVFDIPSKCMNLKRSFLNFNVTVAAPSGGPGNSNHLWTLGCPWFERVELRTRSGTQIVDLNSANVYYRALAPYQKKLQEALEVEPVKAEAATAGAVTSSQAQMVCPNNILASATSAAGANSSARIVNDVKSASSKSYTESEYFIAGADNAATVLNVALPLGEFKQTFLSSSQDSFFQEVIELRLVWAQSGKMGFGDAPAGGAVVASPVPSISELFLYQALQTDPSICNQLIRMVQSGKSQRIPYVYTYREAFNGSTYNRNLRFNASHGDRLLRIMHCNADASESNAKFGQIDNGINAGVGRVVSSFYTSMDNLRQQEVDVQTGASAIDYKFMKDLLAGSCIQDRSGYNHSRVWIDSFDGVKSCDYEEMDDCKNGLNLTGIERQWGLNQTNNGSQAGVNYVFAVTQKMLTQSGGQILLL
jgi:hypothetical protein